MSRFYHVWRSCTLGLTDVRESFTVRRKKDGKPPLVTMYHTRERESASMSEQDLDRIAPLARQPTAKLSMRHELRRCFATLDSDGSGHLCINEVRKVCPHKQFIPQATPQANPASHAASTRVTHTEHGPLQRVRALTLPSRPT